MIELTHGNLLEANVEALVNTVNCVGVMGKGIALQFKQAFPDNYSYYAKSCKSGRMQPGRVLIYKTDSIFNPKYIINFPTKRHWKGKSKMTDIDSGLTDLKSQIQLLGIRTIAIPPLGAGLGGLNWSEVKDRIESTFADLTDIQVLLYEPKGIRETKPSLLEVFIQGSPWDHDNAQSPNIIRVQISEYLGCFASVSFASINAAYSEQHGNGKKYA